MSKDNERKEKSGFVEIRDVLKNEVQRFSSINTILVEGSSEYNKIDKVYSSYGSEMDVSKNHILKLKRREFFENLFIYIGMIIYFSCVAYVMLKRFPVHRIIFFVYYILESIVGGVWDVKEYVLLNYIINNTTSTLNITNATNSSYFNELYSNITNNSRFDYNNTISDL